MACASLMAADVPRLRGDASVAEAVSELIARRHTSLPVVDGDGLYVGMFGVLDLLGLLVPRVALAGDLAANVRFIGADADGLRARFRDQRGRPLSEVADRNAPTLKPDTPDVEAIRLFCHGHNGIAVVDPQSRKVLGVISCWEALRALAPEQN